MSLNPDGDEQSGQAAQPDETHEPPYNWREAPPLDFLLNDFLYHPFAEQVGFPIKRPWPMYPIGIGVGLRSLDEYSWYKAQNIQIDSALAFSGRNTDMRMGRIVTAQMLGEAWNREVFFTTYDGIGVKPTEEERIFLIAQIRHLTTLTGVLTVEEVDRIEQIFSTLDTPYLGTFPFLPTEITQVAEPAPIPGEEFQKVCAMAEAVRTQGGTVGVFHGAFDPPHFRHLMAACFYRQYCDLLIILLDNDEFITNMKAPTRLEGRRHMPEGERAVILKAFPHAFDKLAVGPWTRGIQDAPEQFLEAYEQLGPGVLNFFHPDDPRREIREQVVREAGGIPFTAGQLLKTGMLFRDDARFSSTDLWEMVMRGYIWDMDGRLRGE